MSFALEYRKKHLTAPKKCEAPAPKAKAKPKRRGRKAPPKQVVVAAPPEDTRANRATVLGALLLAAAILAVFNSEGLRLVAGDLAEEEVGRPVLVVSEAWDDAMDSVGAKAIAASSRPMLPAATSPAHCRAGPSMQSKSRTKTQRGRSVRPIRNLSMA